MESLIGFLPVLVLLACPLMMGLCFWGMRRMGCDTKTAPPVEGPVPATVGPDVPVAERIAALQTRLDDLKAEQDAIAGRIAELAWMEAVEHASSQAEVQQVVAHVEAPERAGGSSSPNTASSVALEEG